MTAFFASYGLPLLGVAVLIESFGIPLPGEATLITFGVLASEGKYSIVAVVGVAAVGAIVGDNLGYWLIGRVGGRALLGRWDWLDRYGERTLPRAEATFARYGGRAVFFGRFVSILRYTVAWAAGLARMEWRSFLFWNAAGGVVWATAVGLAAFYLGGAAVSAVLSYGLYAAIGAAVAIAVGWLAVRRLRRQPAARAG